MSMFDEIFEKAKDVTSAATKKTDTMVKISKLKLSGVQINNSIKSEYERLGAVVYEQIKSGEEDKEQVSAIVDVIDTYYGELSDITHKIEDLQNILVCPQCSLRNKTGATYCSNCGAKLAQEVESEVVDDDDSDTGFDSIE